MDFIEAARPKRKAEGFTESESEDSDDERGKLQGATVEMEATSPKVETKEEDEAAKRWGK